MRSNTGVWLSALAAQCTFVAALAANPEQVDYSCPTAPTDQPAVFPQGTKPLDIYGLLHIEDHSQNYRLTFVPRFDMKSGYFDNIVIVGHKYTLNPETQAKTYLLAKDEFRQHIVDIPINYCRSNRIPYSDRDDMKLGHLTIEDEAGRSKSSWASIVPILSCDEGGCDSAGLSVGYSDAQGTLENVQFGAGGMKQDVRIMK